MTPDVRPLVAGNWKMHYGPQETTTFLTDFLNITQPNVHQEWVIFPPSISLPATQKILKNSFVKYGAQNSHFEQSWFFIVPPELRLTSYSDLLLLAHCGRNVTIPELLQNHLA